MKHIIPIYIVSVAAITIDSKTKKEKKINHPILNGMVYKGFTNVLNKNSEQYRSLLNRISQKIKPKSTEEIIINKIKLLYQVGYGVNDL